MKFAHVLFIPLAFAACGGNETPFERFKQEAQKVVDGGPEMEAPRIEKRPSGLTKVTVGACSHELPARDIETFITVLKRNLEEKRHTPFFVDECYTLLTPSQSRTFLLELEAVLPSKPIKKPAPSLEDNFPFPSTVQR